MTVTASPPRLGVATSLCLTTRPSKPEAALPAAEQVWACPHRHYSHCTREQQQLQEDMARFEDRHVDVDPASA